MTPVEVITFQSENSGHELDDKIPRWNLRRAKWDEFKNSCILKLKSDANDTVDNITYFCKTLISIAEESIPRTSSKKSIISHGSMMIVKLQSDHARQLYENSIYSLVLKISITLKFIGQKLVELLYHPRKHLGKITSINLNPPPGRKKYGT